MTRLRYPFAEVVARCRLCGYEAVADPNGGRVGARLIDWRRKHAAHCPEWARWVERKGLRLDRYGAALYPGETGPFVPRSGRLPPAPEAENTPVEDLLALPAEAFDQGALL